MTLSVMCKYLLGDALSIGKVAASRASFWTGLLLVLLTAIARNYDQTHLMEKPFLWVFGPLLFSLFSGTWVFLVSYGIAWGYMGKERPAFLTAWPAFMGLFWMTAPIAWLYAIPVERLFDSMTAASANVTLLAVVSLWRVLLMARVLQVLHGAKFVMALSWVLIPATVEVLGFSVFGGGLERRIMAGMMGMRNSPEEDILVRSVSNASVIALWLLPASILTALVYRMKGDTSPLPPRAAGRVPWVPLSVAACCSVAAAVLPQRELSNNVALERMLAKEDYRAALDYLATRRAEEFAPSRTLPPKPFEGEIFKQLPALMGTVRGSDPAWVQAHLLERLTQMCSHFNHAWRSSPDDTAPWPERIKKMSEGMQWAQRFASLGGQEFNMILDGLNRIPAGQRWRATNQLFLAALAVQASEAPIWKGRNGKIEEAQRADWNAVLSRLARLGITNSVTPVKSER